MRRDVELKRDKEINQMQEDIGTIKSLLHQLIAEKNK
jgi:hypothetical protein